MDTWLIIEIIYLRRCLTEKEIQNRYYTVQTSEEQR